MDDDRRSLSMTGSSGNCFNAILNDTGGEECRAVSQLIALRDLVRADYSAFKWFTRWRSCNYNTRVDTTTEATESYPPGKSPFHLVSYWIAPRVIQCTLEKRHSSHVLKTWAYKKARTGLLHTISLPHCVSTLFSPAVGELYTGSVRTTLIYQNLNALTFT